MFGCMHLGLPKTFVASNKIKHPKVKDHFLNFWSSCEIQEDHKGSSASEIGRGKRIQFSCFMRPTKTSLVHA